jgi:guanylate kinase
MDQAINHKIFLVIGPSGVGKGAVVKEVMKKIPILKRFSSFTTRKPRKGEINGDEYFFVTEKKFSELIKNNQLLEYEEVHPGLLYGTPPEEKIRKLLENNSLIKDIDTLGSQSLKKIFSKNTVSIFLEPPSVEELRKRIEKRGSNSSKEIEERLSRLKFEMDRAQLADYRVVNDKLKKCIKEVTEIIEQEMNK